MTFRAADWGDRELLYAWRLREEAEPWYEGAGTTEDEHARWFRQRLVERLVRIRIWVEDGLPVGVARRDSNDELTYYAVDGDVAARMLAEIVDSARTTKRIKAVLDVGDPRIAQLEQAGFTRYPAVALVYKPADTGGPAATQP